MVGATESGGPGLRATSGIKAVFAAVDGAAGGDVRTGAAAEGRSRSGGGEAEAGGGAAATISESQGG